MSLFHDKVVEPTPQPEAETAVVGTGIELNDEEFMDLYAQFSLSQPIRIPIEKLNPDFEYRFINCLNPNVFQRRRGIGWNPVLADELESLLVPPYKVTDIHLGTHVDTQGRIALGDDLVFARLTKRHALAIKAHYLKINQDRLKSGRRKFHSIGELAGVQTEDIPL